MIRLRLALFENRGEAESIRLRLIENGIAAEVHDELGLAKLWFVARRRVGVRVEVPAKEAERGNQLLSEWDAREGVLRRAIRCPDCKSLRIDYPQFTRKSLLTNVAMGLIAELGLVDREYYCEDCHCMWAGPWSRPRRVRRKMAPDYFLENVGSGPASQSGAGREGSQTRASGHDQQSTHQAKCASAERPSPLHVLHPSSQRLGLALGVGVMLLYQGIPAQLALAAREGPRGATASAAVSATGAAGSASSESPTYLRDVLPILMGKCARCHNDQTPFLRDLLDYSSARAKRWEIKRRVWDSWRGAYFKQPMPTANSPESDAMSEEERATIRDWVESGAGLGTRPVGSDALSKGERVEAGRRLFTTVCAACHQPTGQGLPDRFPPLAGSDFLNADKHRAIKVVVNGLQGEVVVNGRKFNNSMPKFPLSDQDIACALTYVYSSFGNSGAEVTAEEVAAARAQGVGRDSGAQTQSVRASEEKSPFE